MLSKGIIIKGVGGLYSVRTDEALVYCKARGIFRIHDLTPMVGDKVVIRFTNDEHSEGYIEEILPRTNYLVRPAVANITQAIIVSSIKDPDINLRLLDKLTVIIEDKRIKAVICISKHDLNENEAKTIANIYEKAGYKVILSGNNDDKALKEIEEVLKNNITVFTGPSGVGKSTLINHIKDDAFMETGVISKKTGRGKHTTRHVELLEIDKNSFVLDTPGFSSLDVIEIDERNLAYCFPEFRELEGLCKFNSCIHINEPGCEVKKKKQDGEIAISRYNSYLAFMEDIKKNRRY